MNSAVVYLVGIELDRARDAGATKDGYFLGHQVVDCEPGKGFVCEEVRLRLPSVSVCVRVHYCGMFILAAGEEGCGPESDGAST